MLEQAFQYRNGQLFCEDHTLTEIAHQVGTPCYVYSKNGILNNYRFFARSFAALDPLVCYAVKANSNLNILHLLAQEGSGFDVVSAGELYRLKHIGADPSQIVFSGVGKTIQELEMALEIPLLSLNVESLEELEGLAKLTRQKRLSPSLSLRINPDIDAQTHPYIATGLNQHKFGIDLDQIEEVLKRLRQNPQLRLIGLGFHLGSQILHIQPFLDAFLKLKALASTFQSEGFPLLQLDVGGGIGIPYQKEPLPNLSLYAEFLQKHRDDYRILFEPGRFIVGNCGVMINQVLNHKIKQNKHFVIVDGAMNDLMRPSLYQAYHEVLALEKKENRVRADVVGPICESGDFFAHDRHLPDFRPGDYLALMDVGAYGFSLASNYNSRPRAAEVLVNGDGFQIIRRRETLEDLIHAEIYDELNRFR